MLQLSQGIAECKFTDNESTVHGQGEATTTEHFTGVAASFSLLHGHNTATVTALPANRDYVTSGLPAESAGSLGGRFKPGPWGLALSKEWFLRPTASFFAFAIASFANCVTSLLTCTCTSLFNSMDKPKHCRLGSLLSTAAKGMHRTAADTATTMYVALCICFMSCYCKAGGACKLKPSLGDRPMQISSRHL